MKTRIVFGILLLSICSLCLTSCKDDKNDNQEMSFTAFIGSDYKWNNSMEVGLYRIKANNALDVNKKYSRELQSIGYLKAVAAKDIIPYTEGKFDYIAYSPYREDINNNNYTIDIFDQTNLEKLDLLYSNNLKEVQNTERAMPLIFKHCLTKLVIHMIPDSSISSLESMYLMLNTVNAQATFNLLTGTITEQNNENIIRLKMSDGGALATAILIPTDELREGLSVSYDLNGARTNKKLDLTSFKAGTVINVYVNISSYGSINEVNIQNITVSNWD